MTSEDDNDPNLLKSTHENGLDPSVSDEKLEDPLKSVLDSFFESINDSKEIKNEMSVRTRKLPGFLFHDGKSKVVVGNEAKTVSSVSTFNMEYYKLASAEEECERITSSETLNPHEILKVPMSVTDEELKRAFRKISLLVHPDKCSHPKAETAFNIVTQAYGDLQKPEMKDKYKNVYEQAKKRVLKEVSKENKVLSKANKPLIDVESSEVQYRITCTCETLLKELTENIAYAEKCRRANENYERQQAEALLLEEKKEEIEKKKWEETRNVRVECWREFKDDIATKRVKLSAFIPVAHKKETRKPGDRSGTSKPMGIDESYKENWR